MTGAASISDRKCCSLSLNFASFFCCWDVITDRNINGIDARNRKSCMESRLSSGDCAWKGPRPATVATIDRTLISTKEQEAPTGPKSMVAHSKNGTGRYSMKGG